MEGELRILVVDDTEGCRTLYREWLTSEHTVETAANGNRALEMVDDSYDIVLLDRRMPGPDGPEVAAEMREFDVHIVMISSLSADFDIVEYPIDSYVQKPIDRDDLESIVEQYASQQSYHDALEEYFSLTSKLAALEAQHTEAELSTHEEYTRLKSRVAQKRAEVDEAISEHTTDWNYAFKSCGRKVESDEQDREPVDS